MIDTNGLIAFLLIGLLGYGFGKFIEFMCFPTEYSKKVKRENELAEFCESYRFKSIIRSIIGESK